MEIANNFRLKLFVNFVPYSFLSCLSCMSKTKSSEIPHYELLYIVSNKFSEDEVKPIAEKVTKIITDNGGKITLNQDWGKRRLAYAIKGFYHGYYQLVEFDLIGESLNKVDRSLRMSNEVLRHQIVAKKIKTPEEIEKEKKIAEKIAAKNAEEEKNENEKEKAKDKDKIDLKDLDDKLDKILDTDSII